MARKRTKGRYRKCYKAEKAGKRGYRIAVKSIKTGRTTSYLGPGCLRVRSPRKAEVLISKRVAYDTAKDCGLRKGCPLR
jgi:hypothetical protein